MTIEEFKESLYQKIKTLNETIWEGKVKSSNIDQWLNNFDNDEEKINALFLFSQFMYFGSLQIREMLKVLYRDLYKYPIIEKIRRENNDEKNFDILKTKFDFERSRTRFLGIGKSAESGPHLMYLFRQENKLSEQLFINTSEIFELNIKGKSAKEILEKNKLFDPQIKHYVFIDDFCGSGSQAVRYSESIIKSIKTFDNEIKTSYLMLFSTKDGRDTIKSKTLFDYVETVFELDDSFKCFSENSRYYKGDLHNFINKDKLKSICIKHGIEMYKIIGEKEKSIYPKIDVNSYADKHKLGYGDCQLLLGFFHNIPNNTLPIFWYDEGVKNWYPILKRFNKIY